MIKKLHIFCESMFGRLQCVSASKILGKQVWLHVFATLFTISCKVARLYHIAKTFHLLRCWHCAKIWKIFTILLNLNVLLAKLSFDKIGKILAKWLANLHDFTKWLLRAKFARDCQVQHAVYERMSDNCQCKQSIPLA